MDCGSEDEFIIVDDEIPNSQNVDRVDVTESQTVTETVTENVTETVTETVIEPVVVEPEVVPEAINEPTNMDVSPAEPTERVFDITGHRASRVIVSNFGAMRHYCDLCGTDVPDLNSHFGDCPAELDLGPDVDRVFDAGEFLEHLRAMEPEPEAPPIATRFIPGDHINNMEYILNLMAKERLRNN